MKPITHSQRTLVVMGLLVALSLIATAGPTRRDDAIVFRARHGVKYHMLNCQYVRRGAYAVTLKRAKRLSLEPCKRCNPPVLDEPQLASVE